MDYTQNDQTNIQMRYVLWCIDTLHHEYHKKTTQIEVLHCWHNNVALRST